MRVESWWTYEVSIVVLDFCIRHQFVIHAFFMQFSQIFHSLSVPVWIMSLGKFERTTVERMCEPCIAKILTQIPKMKKNTKNRKGKKSNKLSHTHAHTQITASSEWPLFLLHSEFRWNVYISMESKQKLTANFDHWINQYPRRYSLGMHTPTVWFSAYAYFVCVKFQASPSHYAASIQWMCSINLYEKPPRF